MTMEFKFRAIDEQASTYLHPSSSMSYFTEQALRAGYRRNDFGLGNDLFRKSSNLDEAILREIEKDRIREEIMAAEMGRKRLLIEAEVSRREREMMALQRGDGLSHSSPWTWMWMEPRPSGGSRLLEERLAFSLQKRVTRRREIGGLDTFEIMPFERAGKKPKIVGGQGCLPPSLVVKDGFGSKASAEYYVLAAAQKQERWLKHYSSSHKILLVGEGDFSFSTCLAKAFGSAHNMYATSLNSIGFLMQHYGESVLNIDQLKIRGCTVMHDVDATKMADHCVLRTLKFDRIIFNFPLAGFFKNEPRESDISKNQTLVESFFNNAKTMVKDDGEIHISHKSNGIFLEWRIESLAIGCGLRLKEEVPFNLHDYPGYNNKYGFGGDKNFNCNPSKTYKFVLGN
ncbi:uncharacterized protein LOC132308690 [Cornus florida]|uniref:uncharacterized protein LOC132308690 n=1 Tax=Cornus florida TaxID=4283 RepID=UPI00289A276C|nr:uncharacterized protein LOC132308690 [Cornus florida]